MAYTFKYGDRPLDGITIQRAVGRGGFGEVYFALTDSGKQLALKFLRDNADVELRGIQNVLNLKSPHLISIFDVRKDTHGDSWVVMEYVSGPSLRDLLIAEPHGLGPQKAAFFVHGIAQGLAYLHDRGIVHRDLKPGNIFYDDGYVKIGDYGLSKYIPISRHSGQTISVGTVHYMAPEIGSGRYSKAIDVYALGVILYEMLTGRLPFAGGSMGEVLMRHISDKPDLAGIAEPYATVIAKALSKQPEDRYQDAREMAEALGAAREVAENISTFDHSTIASGAAQRGAAPPDLTMTTPPRRPVPVLDAREARWPEQFDSAGNARMQRLARKFERRVTHWQRKFERYGVVSPVPQVRSEDEAAHAELLVMPRAWRITRIAILLLIAVPAAIWLAIVSQRHVREEAVAAILLFMAGAVGGGLFARLFCLPRIMVHTESWIVERVVIASAAAALMAPALAPADDVRGNFGMLIVCLLAPMLILNWRRMIDRGRRGHIDGWSILLAGFIAMIATGPADVRGGETKFVAFALAALTALLTQMAARMWPLARRTRKEAAADDEGQGEREAVAPPTDSMDAPIATPRGMASNVPLEGQGPAPEMASELWGSPSQIAGRPPNSPPLPPPTIIEAPRRPLVRQMANVAGTLLCLVAIAAAIGMNVPTNLPDHSPFAALEPLSMFRKVSRALLWTLALMAGVILVYSRVGQGWAHWSRGVGAAVLIVTLAAVSSAGRLNYAFTSIDSWEELMSRQRLLPEMALVAAQILLAVGLLAWPRRSVRLEDADSRVAAPPLRA